ncbi:MAG: amino acid permease, partial [Gemmatimonadota bacterium]
LKVEGGGEYYIISRSFGATIGAAIGISLYLSQAISVAFYMIAFAEAFRPLFALAQPYLPFAIDPRMISLPASLLLISIMLTKGADLGVKALWGVAGTIGVALVMFLLGKSSTPPEIVDLTSRVANPDSFTVVFAICFPAFTGMTAGVGLSGDLKNPRRSIPLGTMMATLIGMVVYVLVVFKLRYNATPEQLAGDPLIMSQIAVWGPIVPIGLAAATISSALGSLLVAPRTLQALASDQVFPVAAINRFLSRGRGAVNEPINATLATATVAVAFIALGDVDFVAQIISMFFMVTYGALCGISFLQHFAANPSYRPSFRSKWYLSLLGAVMCFMMMFQMQPLYAVLSLVVLATIYLWVRSTHQGARGLAAIFQGAMFQLTRWLQIQLQKNQGAADLHDWRPSFIGISRHSEDRLAPFEVLKWISHRYGFGSLIHFVEGYLSKEQIEETNRTVDRLIARTEASGAGIFIDSMVSPSFTTALAQTIQMPGVSGLGNNSVLFDFSEDHAEELPEIVKGCLLAGSLGFNTCVLRSTDHFFGYHQKLHVWLTRFDDANANLMILLAYIIMGHPDWRAADLTIYAIFPADSLEEEVADLHHRIATGRLPISALNVRALPADDQRAMDELVLEHSRDADLLIAGYGLGLLKNAGQDVFLRHAGSKDILFVNANQEVSIS